MFQIMVHVLRHLVSSDCICIYHMCGAVQSLMGMADADVEGSHSRPFAWRTSLCYGRHNEENGEQKGKWEMPQSYQTSSQEANEGGRHPNLNWSFSHRHPSNSPNLSSSLLSARDGQLRRSLHGTSRRKMQKEWAGCALLFWRGHNEFAYCEHTRHISD